MFPVIILLYTDSNYLLIYFLFVNEIKLRIQIKDNDINNSTINIFALEPKDKGCESEGLNNINMVSVNKGC